MATKSGIEWTGYTWNPVTGCDKVSPGCKNCYADRMAKRLKAMDVEKYRSGFELAIHNDIVEEPLTWKKSRLVFVNSMSDLFHEEIPFHFIQRVFDVMRRADRHTFQILTKRSERLEELSSLLDWPSNVWMGVSVENDSYVYRVDHLKKTAAKIKFLSLEPLLGPLPSLYIQGIDWIIVGGESGPKARPIEEEWVVSIRDQCVKHGVPFFFKQWGGKRKKTNGRLLQGQTWSEMPTAFSRNGSSLK